MATATTIPIPTLDPDTSPPADTSIRAIVALSWPYSSATKQCSLLLSDPDFRLRNRKGQVRVSFTGPSAEAVAKAKLGIGDEVLLELRGGKWRKIDTGGVQTPGKSVDGELVFGGKLGLKVVERAGVIEAEIEDEDGWVRVDEKTPPGSPERGQQVAQNRTPAARRGRVAELRSSLGGGDGSVPVYASPAFARKFRLSGDDVGDLSASDPFIDAYWEEGSPRKRQRLSFTGIGKWRLEGQERSPVQGLSDEMDLDQDENLEAGLEEDISSERLNTSPFPDNISQTESTQHMPPPRLPEQQQSFIAPLTIPTEIEAPSTPKLHPVPASSLPLPSPFPADEAQRMAEVQFPTNIVPERVDDAREGEVSRPPMNETSQESSTPNTDSQGALNIPSQEAPSQLSQPSLAFTESAPESSMPDMDSQNVPTGIYAIGNRSVDDGTYRSQVSNPELLSDTEEDENMYEDDLRDRADDTVRGQIANNYDDDVVRDDDVDEVIDDMGEEPLSSDEDEDVNDDDDDEDEEWEDEVDADSHSANAAHGSDAAASNMDQNNEYSIADGALPEPDVVVVDDSEDDTGNIILPEKPAETSSKAIPPVDREPVARPVQLMDERAAASEVEDERGQFARQKRASEPHQEVSEGLKAVNPNTQTDDVIPLVSEQTAEPQARELAVPHAVHEPPTATAAQTSVWDKPLTAERPSLPETPAKVNLANFGREGVGSAVSAPKSTPQSKRDRIMARTYSSLFGFSAPKPTQPTFQTPTPNAGDLPKHMSTGWGWSSVQNARPVERPQMSPFGAPPIMKLPQTSVDAETADTLPPAPVEETKKQDEVKELRAQDQDVNMQDSQAPVAPNPATVDVTLLGPPNANDMADVDMEAEIEDPPSEDVADVLPMPEKLENIDLPPSSAPRPTQTVHVIDLGSSDEEDSADDETIPNELVIEHAEVMGEGPSDPTLPATATELASDDYGEDRPKAGSQPASGEAEIMETQFDSQATVKPAVAVEPKDAMVIDERAREGTPRAEAVQDSTAAQAARLEDPLKDAVQVADAASDSEEAADQTYESSVEVNGHEQLSDAEILSPAASFPPAHAAYREVTAQELPEEASFSADADASVSHISESQQTIITARPLTASQVRTRRSTALSSDQPSHPASLPTPQISDLRSQEAPQTSANNAILPPTPQLSQGDSLPKELQTNNTVARPTTPEPLSRRTRANSRVSSRASVEPITGQPKTPSRRSTRSQAQNQIYEEAIEETAEDTIAVHTPSPKKTASRSSARKPQTETAVQEIKMDHEPKAAQELASPARKSFTARLSTVPEAISAWFTPRRSNRLHSTDDAPDASQPHGLSTSLGYYHALSALSQKLNPPSQSYADNTIDILAIVTTATSTPKRAKSGPRDYYITFRVWDRSISTTSQDSILVEVFRPWHATLPVAEVGDGVLLRGFAVKSRKRNPYLLSTDASGWCVWRYGEEVGSGEKHTRSKGSFGAVGGAREEVKGPPVEIGREEREWVEELGEKWVESKKE